MGKIVENTEQNANCKRQSNKKKQLELKDIDSQSIQYSANRIKWKVMNGKHTRKVDQIEMNRVQIEILSIKINSI